MNIFSAFELRKKWWQLLIFSLGAVLPFEVDLIRDVKGQEPSTAQMQSGEPLWIGIAALKEIADQYSYASLKMSFHHETKDRVDKIQSSGGGQVEISLLRDHFRIHTDEAVDGKPLGKIDLTFDGKLVRTFSLPRDQSETRRLSIANISDENVLFVDRYPFWPILGYWSFMVLPGIQWVVVVEVTMAGCKTHSFISRFWD